jgi:hypothetical protein
VVLAVSARLAAADPSHLLDLCRSLPRAELLFWTGTGEPPLRAATEAALRGAFASLDAHPPAAAAADPAAASAAAAPAAQATVAARAPATRPPLPRQSRVGFDVARGGSWWVDLQVFAWRYGTWALAVFLERAHPPPA